ncbi:hypothetical protein Goklo_024794, partial [Gossypium klotzschianum]|nr:hypothetical protein [Gossypium klotzschianum]
MDAAQSWSRTKWVFHFMLVFAHFSLLSRAEDGMYYLFPLFFLKYPFRVLIALLVKHRLMCCTCLSLDVNRTRTCLVANGDFETPPSGGFPSEAISDGASEIPSWSTNGTVKLVSAGEKVSGGMLLIVPRGRHAVRLGNDAEISQEVTVEKGSAYAVTFSAARTCAQMESLNVSVPPASQTVDLQTLYNVQGWDPYTISFEAEEDKARLIFRNPGMEDDPECGPIIDDIAIKKLITPDKPKDNAVVNSGFEFGPWMFQNVSLGVLLPTNLDEETSPLPGWMVESNRAVRYIDSNHY